MKLLVIGDMTWGTNSRSIMEAGRVDGHDVRTIDIGFATAPRPGSSIWRSLRTTQMVPQAANNSLRTDLRALTNGWHPDVLLAVKTVMFDQSVILGTSAGLHVHLSFDDVSNPDNISVDYLLSERNWNAIITTKRHNVKELEARGVRSPIAIAAAFDPVLHFRNVSPTNRVFDVGFIGAARPDRIDLPKVLSTRFPGRAAVFGPRWRRHYPVHLLDIKLRHAVYGNEYALASNSMRAGLVLLNSENRDTHTNRTFEVPATGQLVVAPRTRDHASLFDDGRDAILFDSLVDGLDRLAFALKAESRWAEMADRGHRVITTGGNTYVDRFREILGVLRG